MKKRIGIVTSCIDNRPARGTALVARRFLERLNKYSDQFEFVLIHKEKTNDPIYIKYEELIIPSKKYFIAGTLINEVVFWLKQRRKGKKFDLVHYLQPRVWPSYLLTNTKKVVLTPHEAGIMLDLMPVGKGERLFRFTNRWLNWRMDKLIAVSEFGRKEIAKYFHLPIEKIEVVYNGIDDIFKPQNESSSLLENKYGIKKPFILSVGRMDPHKNLLRLINAYKEIADKGHEETLVLVGGRHLPEYSDKVESKIKELGLQDRVYIAPYIEQGDLPTLYSEASMLVYPSLHEGFGLPTLEAMACNTPVASSSATALPEICGDAAIFFDPNNEKGIIDKMEMLLTDEELRASLIKKGTERVKQFTWDKSAEKIVKIYQNLLLV